MIGKLKTIR